MSNYTDDARSVRVDFFKPSGKWYTTEAVRWPEGRYDDADMWDALLSVLPKREDGTYRYSGMRAVCLEPYSKFSHPIMVTVPE